MDAAFENISYKYRAPLRYLFFIMGFLLIGVLASLFFAAVEPWIFRVVILFIMAVSFGGAIAFLIHYLRALSDRIVFSRDSVALPTRERSVLKYSDISNVEEMHKHNRVLKITARGRTYLIEESRMCKGRFDAMAGTFREKTVH